MRALLRELQELQELHELAAPRRRWWTALGVTTGLLAVGGGLGVDRYVAWVTRCTGARAQLDGIWDDARKQDVEAAITATELTYAPGTWERVEQRLDEYAEAWVAKHTDVCEATRAREEQTEADMSLRMSCMADRKLALQAAVGVLTKADATVVHNAVKLVTDLPRLSRCDDLEALRAELPPPEDPVVSAHVQALRERLAAVVALEKAGHYERSSAEIDAVLEETRALGYVPLVAEAMLRRGDRNERAARYLEAERDYQEAHGLALEHRHDDVAFFAARGLTHLVGDLQARHAEGRVWGQTAIALAKRNGDDAQLAQGLSGLGVVLRGQGEPEEAQRYLERALQLMEGAAGPDAPELAESLANLAGVLYAQGQYEQARRYQERSLQIEENALGSDHPDVAVSLNNLGLLLRAQGEHEAAQRHLERALHIKEKALGPDHPDVATGLTNLALVLRARGELEQAQRIEERALHIKEKALGPDHPQVAFSLYDLGAILHERGDDARARRHHERALEIREAALGTEHPLVVKSLLGLTDVLLAQGEHDAARARAERAVSILEATQATPTALAEARFALARTLWSDRAAAARARALAQQARDTLATVGTEAMGVAEIEAWLAQHPAP